MRRFDAYLAEKLSDPEFAEAFWDAEAKLSLKDQIEQMRQRLSYEELIALPELHTTPSTPPADPLQFPTRTRPSAN